MTRASFSDLLASATALLFIVYLTRNVAAIGSGGTLNILLGLIFFWRYVFSAPVFSKALFFVRLELFAIILFLIWFFYRVQTDTLRL